MTGGPATGPYPLDWAPLAPANPIPGDPAAVTDLAGTMAATAAVTRGAASDLRQHRSLASWQGCAAQAFASVAADLPPFLERVAARYDGAAQALTAYAGELIVARAQAAAALAAARGPSPDLVAARRALAEALGTHDRAAGAAAARLAAVAHDGLQDHRSLLGRLTHAAADFTIHTAHLEKVSAVLGIAALGAAFVLPPVAAALEVAAVATGGVALAAQTELAGSGDGSWGDAGATAAGLALFGASRVYGATTRAAGDLGRAQHAVLQAGTDAQQLAEANAALAAARAALPRHSLVPRREHLMELSPKRLVHVARADWVARHNPRPSSLGRALETTEALRGRVGVAVAANTLVKVTAEAESRRRTASDALPDRGGAD